LRAEDIRRLVAKSNEGKTRSQVLGLSRKRSSRLLFERLRATRKEEENEEEEEKRTHAMAISSASFSIAAAAVLFNRCRADMMTLNSVEDE
jgi:hypothetical protein|tara:strand:+ start:1563 stop:1835 length:273 start_codon:yes stop_codon:yes gene_type:complete